MRNPSRDSLTCGRVNALVHRGSPHRYSGETTLRAYSHYGLHQRTHTHRR
ncbi:hypothetical protein ACFPRL_13360 [Pseudoclavibacter helvolus]